MEISNRARAGKFLMSLAVMFILTIMLVLIMAFIQYKMKLTGSQAEIGIKVIYIAVNLIGGFVIGKCMGSRGFFWGITIGLVYFIIVTAISAIITGSFASSLSNGVIFLAFCGISGMIGGMIS
ncbi:MAG: TIGR04086 family membrane protein [Eubacterium sp.]